MLLLAPPYATGSKGMMMMMANAMISGGGGGLNGRGPFCRVGRGRRDPPLPPPSNYGQSETMFCCWAPLFVPIIEIVAITQLLPVEKTGRILIDFADKCIGEKELEKKRT